MLPAKNRERIMSDLTNSEYFAHRAAEAWEMSKAASDPRAVRAHTYMARQYEALAAEFDVNASSCPPQNGQSQLQA